MIVQKYMKGKREERKKQKESVTQLESGITKPITIDTIVQYIIHINIFKLMY